MFKKLFPRPRRPQHSGPRESRAYAIGDIHGRLDLLNELLEVVERDHAARPAAKTYLVFLGDYVDRGPDSKGVLDRLLDEPPSFARNIFLRGNHEEFFLGALGGDEDMLPNWLIYGGAECAQSYGVGPGFVLNSSSSEILDRLKSSVPERHLQFLHDLADSFRFGDYLFVHAGIRPGIPIEQQRAQDLRWIREGFLDDKTDHGLTVVHGHTIVPDVEEHPNRIAIDTGAYKTGTLTALGIEGSTRWLLQTEPKL